MNNKYIWIDFYSKFIDVLMKYIDDRATLISKIKNVYKTIGINR